VGMRPSPAWRDERQRPREMGRQSHTKLHGRTRAIVASNSRWRCSLVAGFLDVNLGDLC